MIPIPKVTCRLDILQHCINRAISWTLKHLFVASLLVNVLLYLVVLELVKLFSFKSLNVSISCEILLKYRQV